MQEQAPKQYPLQFHSGQSLAAEDYIITECNQNITAQLLASREPVILVVGAPGSGKTHMMRWLAAKRDCAFVDIAAIGNTPAGQWIQAEHCYVLEDIELITNEAALAQAINHVRALPAQLILTAAHKPDAAGFKLADLLSRLKAAQILLMPAPDDILLQALFHKYLADLQWRCDKEVGQYIMARLPRDMVSLKQFIDCANVHALAEKRALTIPFAARVLKELGHVSG